MAALQTGSTSWLHSRLRLVISDSTVMDTPFQRGAQHRAGLIMTVLARSGLCDGEGYKADPRTSARARL